MLTLIHTSLSRGEWDLVSSLREVPEGRLRSRLNACLQELVAFARDPHCSDMQADGVPCVSAKVACDQCQQAEAFIEDLRAQVRQG